MAGEWSIEELKVLRRMRVEGKSYSEIGGHLGRTKNAAAMQSLRIGIGKKAPERVPKVIPVPVWVPDELRAEYIARARKSGEPFAARWARAAKRAK